AFWLAKPVLTGAPDLTPWTVIAPGVPAADVQRIAAGEGERRWLAEGFPALDTPASDRVQPTASLLRELDAQLPQGAPLTVVVPEALGGLDGERPRLSRDVDWQVLAGESPAVDHEDTLPRWDLRHDPAHAQALRYLQAALESL